MSRNLLSDPHTVLVYRDQLLPYSETFIPAQGEAYSLFQALYVGSSRIPGAPPMLPQDRCITLDLCEPAPAIWKTLYKLAGYCNPRWIELINAQSPQLIHAHFGLDGVLAMPLARQLKLPLIVTFHGYFATTQLEPGAETSSPLFWFDYIYKRGSFFRQLYLRRQQKLFNSAQKIIAVSEHIQRSLIMRGCPPEKIQVHYIGIDLNRFQLAPWETRRPCVLFVGRLVEKKGCEYLIRAMAQVQAAQPDSELVILGDGSLRPKLESLAAQTLKSYRFEGSQSPETVRAWMARAQVLAAPSVTSQCGETEGLPMVILEAMAVGLPVVSTVHAGIPEAIAHGKTGLLVPERQAEALSKEILKLLNTPSFAQELSMAGRRQVESRFDLHVNARGLEDLYVQVAKLSG